MKYLKISNKGKIDVKAFQKIGISTKVGDASKIGRFGSGLNYAIAWLMRNDVKFKVFSGHKEIKFHTVEYNFRDIPANFIVVNGEETSFCTKMGGDIWEAWMMIREIYCNALDEPGGTYSVVEDAISEDDITNFYIELTEEIEDVVNNWDNYFAYNRDDLLFESDGIKLYKGGEKLICYRKGIKCFEYNVPCVFHYDISNIKINESRIVNDVSNLNITIAQFLAGKVTTDIIKLVCDNISNTYEARMDWDWWNVDFNDQWAEVLKEKRVVENEHHEVYSKAIETCASEVVSLPSSMVTRMLKSSDDIEHVASDMGKAGKGPIRLLEDDELAFIESIKSNLSDIGYGVDIEISGYTPIDTYNKHYYKKGVLYISDSYFKNDLEDQLIVLIMKYNELYNSKASSISDNSYIEHLINRLLITLNK